MIDEESREVVVAASASEETIGVWDVHTGTYLTTYKGNTSGRNCFTALGRDFIVAGQAGKSKALHAWTWHKDQVHQRSFAPEALACLASTRDGCLLAGGGESGAVYLWETGSGRLLASFPAHYKAVTALAFTDDSCQLLSGGADSAVHAWLLMQLLDAGARRDGNAAAPEPMHAWMGHSLAVTGLHVGPGNAPLVASVSDDRTCRLWSTALGRHLQTLTLPQRLCCVAADAWEHSLFLGAADGRIFAASLLEADASRATATLAGHTAAVECLALAGCGHLLVSGSADGSVRVWDVQTREVRLAIEARGPVTGLLLLRQPAHMAVQRSGDASGKRGPARPQPLAPLRKFFDTPGGDSHWQGPPVLLDGTQPYKCVVAEAGLLQAAPEPTGAAAAPASGEAAGLREDKRALEEQLAGATQTIAELRAVNAKLHAFLVEQAAAADG